jgi:acyl-CoA synthetase (AMP-forming)/AMP-acid ligase II
MNTLGRALLLCKLHSLLPLHFLAMSPLALPNPLYVSLGPAKILFTSNAFYVRFKRFIESKKVIKLSEINPTQPFQRLQKYQLIQKLHGTDLLKKKLEQSNCLQLNKIIFIRT